MRIVAREGERVRVIRGYFSFRYMLWIYPWQILPRKTLFLFLVVVVVVVHYLVLVVSGASACDEQGTAMDIHHIAGSRIPARLTGGHVAASQRYSLSRGAIAHYLNAISFENKMRNNTEFNEQYTLS